MTDLNETIEFDAVTIGKRNKADFFHGLTAMKYIQSVCYDSWNGRYIVGFSDAESQETATIIQMKDLRFTDDSVLLVNTNQPLRHCNDLEYDPVNRLIYVARGDKTISIISPDSLQKLSEIQIDAYVWSIARYQNGDWFIHDGDRSIRYSQYFTSKTILSEGDTERVAKALNVPRVPDGRYAGYWQGAVMIDDSPYMIYTEWQDSFVGFKACAFIPCGNDGRSEIYRCETTNEAEGACLVDGNLKIVYGQNNIGGANWEMSEMKMKTVYGTIKDVEIPAETNVELDCRKFVPDGYELTSANANFKKDNQYRTLPYSDANGKTILRILRIKGNKVIIRSLEGFQNTTLQITGFCRRK